MGTNDKIVQGMRQNFTNAFSNNLNTINLKIFPDHGGRHFENMSLPVHRIMGEFILGVDS